MSLLTHFLQKVKRKLNNNLVASFDIRDQIENKNERTMEFLIH